MESEISREPPVHVKHDADDSQQGEDAGHDAQQRGGDKVLNAVDVARHPADEVAGSFFIVFGERQAMNVVIKRAPQVVHDPLADVSGEIVFQVGTDCADNGDGRHCSHRKVEDGEFALSRSSQPPRSSSRAVAWIEAGNREQF